MNGLERCAGCGIHARVSDGGHPMVAVMKQDDAEKLGFTGLTASPRGFVQVPTCKACHVDPAHRVFTVKGTFFARADAQAAVGLAGINEVLMPRTN